MFKEYVKKDIANTFINLDEFSETVNINGAEVSVMEDHDRLEYEIKRDYGGLIIGDILFYISEEEYKKIPQVNYPPETQMAISYQGMPCTVINVSKQMGVYEITLQSTGGAY